jgi:hypothetical protein
MMYKKVFLLSLISAFILMSFTACGGNNDIIETKENNSTGETSTGNIPDDKAVAFTLIMPENLMVGLNNFSRDIKTDNTAYVDVIKTQLSDAGFDINIEIVPYGSASEDYRDAYKKYVEARLKSGENVAFVAENFSRSEIGAMITNGQIMEIAGVFKDYAQGYYEKTYGSGVIKDYLKYKVDAYKSHNLVYDQNGNKIYGIPIGGESQNFDYPALLVRKEIAEEYDKEIDSIDDYGNLLMWIKKNVEEYTPGCFPYMDLSMHAINNYPCFDIVAHANGYSELNMLIGEGISDFYYKCDDMQGIVKNGGVDIVNYTQIPGFRESMLELRKWIDDGLIHIWTDLNYDFIYPYSHATILTNTNAYLHPEWTDTKYFIDAEEYVIYLFNEDGMFYSGCKKTQPFTDVIYVSSNSSEPEEILRFIEWLYTDQENHDLFIYGKKGVDYEIDNNDRITFLDNSNRANWGEKQFTAFINSSLDRIKSYCPYNWEDVLFKLSRVPGSTDTLFNDYIIQNTDTSNSQLSIINSNNAIGPSDATVEEILAPYYRTKDFLDGMYISLADAPEEIVDGYIKDITDMPSLKKFKEKYYSHINALMECLNK